MKERDFLSRQLDKLLPELPDSLEPPTFTQMLRNWWQTAPATTRVTAVLLGVLATSILVSTIGVGGMKLGEIFNSPTLTEAGKLVTLTAASVGIVSPTVAMLALTFFEERLNPTIDH